MSEFGGIREVSISGSDDRLCRFHISLLRARETRTVTDSRAASILLGLFLCAVFSRYESSAIYFAARDTLDSRVSNNSRDEYGALNDTL